MFVFTSVSASRFVGVNDRRRRTPHRLMEFISQHALHRLSRLTGPLQTMTPPQLHADSVAQPRITHRNKIIEKR